MNIEDLKPLREAAIKELEEMHGEDQDYESNHLNADAILCDILGYMGCQDVVDAFDKVGKWYA